MTKINIAETKAHLSKYINMAEFGGEEIVIQKHGRPVAALINIDLYEKLKQLEEPLQENNLVYKKLDYRKHIISSSYSLDQMLAIVGEDNTDTKPFADVEDVVTFSKELRDSAWKR